ncbi:MAG: hypothetical protein JW939_08475 [Candidatus Thermoplasmatota archaeon]|nr:hypothetical protein [Candidatus Thermoplasmatota archaeon]
MIEPVKTAYRYFLIMGTGITLLVISVMVPVLSSDADFSIYNSGWNGCSDLGRDVYRTGSFIPTVDISGSTEERVAHGSFSELRDMIRPGETSLMIIGPSTEFTRIEGEFVHDLLMRGGTLLLADDFGTGNQLLSYLNTTTRITEKRMLDLSYMKDTGFSVTTETTDHPVCDNVSMLMLNAPSTISPSPGARSVLNSSRTSWIDLDGDERLGDDEPLGPFPLMTVEKYGRGELIVLSEPSLLINQMNDHMDNGRFVLNIVDIVTAGKETTVIDESHRDVNDPVRFMNFMVTDLGTDQKVGLLVLVTVIFIFLNTPFPGKIMKGARKLIDRVFQERERAKEKSDEPLEVVASRHPDWDRRVLERLVKEIEGNT